MLQFCQFIVGCMRCFQLSKNYVVFYVCHKSTSVFVSSVGSYCRVVFEVRCLLHIIAVVCELMVLVSNRVVLLVVNVAFPCRGVVSVAYQGCTMFVHPV